MKTKATATIADLYSVPGKAELIDGEIVRMAPTGYFPGRAGYKIVRNLDDYAQSTGTGYAVPDNVGFIMDQESRWVFSPDAAFYSGDNVSMKFIEGVPIFAAEVRSDNDYGPAAEREIAEKRRHYFAAGTQVVWDVDLNSEDVVRVYRASDPSSPTIYRRGDIA